MRGGLLVVALAALGPGDAIAAQSCSTATMWGGARLGMTKAEFASAFPGGRIEALPGCPAYINGKFEHDQLTKIVVVRARTIVGCPTRLEEDLTSRMGPPNRDERFQPTIYFGALPIGRLKTVVNIWTDECLLIALHKPASGDKSFTVIFQAKSDPSKPVAW